MFDGAYEFRMAGGVRLELTGEVRGRFVEADRAVEIGARHEDWRTADTEGHNSQAAEARFWERSQYVGEGHVFVDGCTGSAMEEAMISYSTAADAARKEERTTTTTTTLIKSKLKLYIQML